MEQLLNKLNCELVVDLKKSKKRGGGVQKRIDIIFVIDSKLI